MVEGEDRERDMQTRTLITNRARSLRKAMSPPEVMLWTRLRGRASDKPTFRRQHPMGSTIVDFYCPSARLVVEVDGSTHWDERSQRRDLARDQWLERQGVIVLRVDAASIYRDANAVVEAIVSKAQVLRANTQGGA